MKIVKYTAVALCCLTSVPTYAAPSDDEWQFSLAPLFIWGSNLNGSAQAGPSNLPLALDFKDDLLSNLDAVFTFHFEAQKNNLILFAEYQNMELGPSTTGPLGADIDVTFKNISAEVGVGYVIAEHKDTDYELLGGIRRLEQDISMNINVPEGVPLPTSLSTGDSWYDGFVGARIKSQLSENWQFIFRGDIGAGGSDFAWNTMAQFDYRFTQWGSLILGYRAMGYEFDNGNDDISKYGIDVTMQGPVVGLNLHW